MDRPEDFARMLRAALEPGDLDAVAALARAYPRDRPPLEAQDRVPLRAVLARYWGARPEDRSPTDLFLAAMGCRALPPPEAGELPWMQAQGRVAEAQGLGFDPVTGLPLRLVDPQGAVQVLVPEGPSWMGSDEEDDDAAPRHQVVVGSFYIDVEVRPELPRPFTAATALASRLGGRLPTEAEAEKALRGPDGGHFAWGFDLHQGPEVEVGPFGLRGLHEDLKIWCLDRYDAEAYRGRPDAPPLRDPWVAADEGEDVPRVVRGTSPLVGRFPTPVTRRFSLRLDGAASVRVVRGLGALEAAGVAG